MKPTQKTNKDSLYNLNLNDLVHAFIREFSMACKKASIYGPNHPSTKRAVEKPFLLLDQFFEFKNYINFNIQQGYLYLLNIRLKESVFNEEIIRYMQVLDIKAILFNRRITLGELEKFIYRFVKRVNLTDHSNLLSSYIERENIDTIEVNSELSYRFFEEKDQYRGDVSHDFSIRNMIIQQLPDSIVSLAKIYNGDAVFAESLLLDYPLQLVTPLIPDKVTSLTISNIDFEVTDFIKQVASTKDTERLAKEVALCHDLCRLLEYHQDYESITEKLEQYITCESIPEDFIEDLKTPTAKIKIDTVKNIDNIMQETFSDLSIEFNVQNFTEGFERLLKIGQKEKAADIAEQLVDYLGSQNYDFRQKALSLLLEITKPLNLLGEAFLFDRLTQVILRNLFDKKETFEYSEYIWELIEKTLHEKNYSMLAKIMQGLHIRRRIENNVTVYDSLAIKKVYMNFNQRLIIQSLITELLKGNNTVNHHLKEIFIATGTEEVAMALSTIISHSNRQIRQIALKILGELGHATLEVFSRILIDDEMFVRNDDRRELPDSKWFIIRNSIFVFGLLKDQKANIPLRMRINDPDIRVRREIISALEKIGGEESIDTLMMMADDDDKEIRESAVIAIGLAGTPDVAPLLISLIERNHKIAIKAVNALGQIGGDEALTYLSTLIGDPEKLRSITDGIISRDDLRLAVIKALGRLGDTGAIKTLENFQENQSTTQKIFFKNSPINKAVKDILSQKK